jgi:hypothetical protein
MYMQPHRTMNAVLATPEYLAAHHWDIPMVA